MAFRDESPPFHSAKSVTIGGVSTRTSRTKAPALRVRSGPGSSARAPRAVKKIARKKLFSEVRRLRATPLTGKDDNEKPAKKAPTTKGSPRR